MQIIANPLSSSSKPTLFLVSVSMHSPLLHLFTKQFIKIHCITQRRKLQAIIYFHIVFRV